MSASPTEPDIVAGELAAEQAHIDRAYGVLDRMRGGADEALPETLDDEEAAGGTFQARAERELAEAGARRRVDELRWGDAPLCFGRIDTDDDSWHIGRIGVSARGGDQLVVDWRAPVAEPFYRATRSDPMGLHLRRSFHCRGRRLLAIDEVAFDDDTLHGEARVGEAALLASLEQPRTGRMGDIVATVQAEQDEIIRAPMAGITLVQGGAGTGKTVVALHRAAYLLYTWRTILEDQGVLVIGPNTTFLNYVRDVLPALGEHNVRLATIDELFPGVDLLPEADLAVASLKGDLRMATLVRRALATRRRRLRAGVEIPFGRFLLRLSADEVNSITAEVRRLMGTHNERRRFVEDDLATALYDDFVDRIASVAPDTIRNPGKDDVISSIRRTVEWRSLLDAVWPRLTPQQLVGDLFAHESLLRHASRNGLLADDEWKRLHRVEPTWTDADVPLLHEAFGLLGPHRRRRTPNLEPSEDVRFIADRVVEHVQMGMELKLDEVMKADLRRNVAEEIRQNRDGDIDDDDDLQLPGIWGYVLIDEAQDLSPMAWRMVARSCPNQSMTLVGDLAQGTRPWAPESGDEVAAAIEPRRPITRHDLHVNYRTPAEIMAVAAPYAADPHQARAVRHGATPRWIDRTDHDAVADAIRTMRAALSESDRIAVIAAAPRIVIADDDDIAWHTPESAKGLEFDGVVVVDPDALLDRTRGEAALYIALTRATKQLSILHRPDTALTR